MTTNTAAAPSPSSCGGLPELASVHWREPVTAASLRRTGRLWTLTTVAHTVPLIAAAAVLVVLNPITVPVALILLAHAWAIPELYAARGARVVHTEARSNARAERVALGFLGDLLDHGPRELYHQTGLVFERGRLGAWLVGERGAVLVRRGGRRVDCWCVRPVDEQLPAADRVAHLLLALRADESGFATVANLVFSGAWWRLCRRVPEPARDALRAARLSAGRPT